MSQPACNKCKLGFASIGDSWCTGCSALELSQSHLRLKWNLPGLRAIAEETLLSSARLVRAFSNLDRSLSSGSAGSQSRAPGTETPPSRPELPRLRSRSPRGDKTPRSDRKEEGKPRSKAAAEPPSEEDYEAESEEEPSTPKRASGAVEKRAPPHKAVREG